MSAAVIMKGLILSAAALLVGCNSSGRSLLEQEIGPRSDPNATKPAIFVNAPQSIVHETLTQRARQRGTNIIEIIKSGVTLEILLSRSSDVVERQCGQHQFGRRVRVILYTEPFGTGTAVTEDRFVIDDPIKPCKLNLTQADIEEGKNSLAGLKREVELRVRTRQSEPRAQSERIQWSGIE
jgi:hypothetical protein